MIKRCSSPYHEGDRWLPATEEHFWFRRSGDRAGTPLPRCKKCLYKQRKYANPDRDHGWIDAYKVKPLLQELVARCGSQKAACEYSGISSAFFWRITTNRQAHVRKHHVRLIIIALYERRKDDRRNGSSELFRQLRKKQAEQEAKMLRLAGY